MNLKFLPTIFTKITGFFQGRHTMFALFFTIIGSILAWKNKLDPNFVAFASVMQGWVFAHSYKEDKFQQPSSTGDMNQGPSTGGNS